MVAVYDCQFQEVLHIHANGSSQSSITYETGPPRIPNDVLVRVFATKPGDAIPTESGVANGTRNHIARRTTLETSHFPILQECR